jgi:antitoxin (DNA-binding transcriptional repressor) of toxin-antitoxin stability system
MKIAIDEANAQFAKIIRRAEAGEQIELTRYGRGPVCGQRNRVVVKLFPLTAC